MPHSAPALPVEEEDRVRRALGRCHEAHTVEELRLLLMDALREEYGFENTTFLSGDTFRRAFSDPDPVTTGRITPILDEYQARWWHDDMFSLPRSYTMLACSPALNAEQIAEMPSEKRDYLEQFLHRHRLYSASLLHVRLPHRWHGLVGIFDDDGKQPSAQTHHGLAELATGLSELALGLPMTRERVWSSRLSPRLMEVADLIVEGFTNDEIADALNLSPESVKTYVSRLFALTEIRNRTELVRIASSAPLR